MNPGRGAASGDPQLDEYLALLDKVDAFCASATRASGARLRCGPGCSACCRAGLTLSPVEAHALARASRSLPQETWRALVERAGAGPNDACALLDEDGRCATYDARPLVCRTQGLALAYPAGWIPEGARVGRDRQGRDLTHCPLSFPDAAPPPEAVLDAQRLDALLALVNHRFARRARRDPQQRVAITELLRRRGA